MTEVSTLPEAPEDHDDSSQDPAQPPVGPAIQFHELIVPDDEPVVDSHEYGEVIDHTRKVIDDGRG
jgi:hypothetical protein